MIVDRALRRSKRSFNATWNGMISLKAQLGVSGEYIASGGTSQIHDHQRVPSNDMSSIQQSSDTRATPSPTGARSRRSHTKSRHGCLGCKQRRKKVSIPTSFPIHSQLIPNSLTDLCSVTRYDRNVHDALTRTPHASTLVCQSRGL
jgi:hypothetical protein